MAALVTDRRLWTIDEAADELRLSTRTVYRLMQAGSLPAVRIGGRTLIESDELAAFVDRHRTRGSSP
jgi:excisionase family DNA binding protein